MRPLTLSVAVETWPLRQAFVIARGAKTEATVVTVALSDGTFTGRGECVPYARYGETVAGVAAAIEAAQRHPSCIASRDALAAAMPPGAARAALDCALWDLEAKRSGTPAFVLAELDRLQPLETCFTISLGLPHDMATAAVAVPHLKLLKLKLGGAGDPERMRAVRAARPDARIVADANESWTVAMLAPFLEAAAAAGIELVEQPLPADLDSALENTSRAVPLCADESAHVSETLPDLARRYDAINIKLDKAGGLTEALAMTKSARSHGLKIMAGSMVSTSLAVAPACLLGQFADWVDLDGPLLLAKDRPHGLEIKNGIIQPPAPQLWG